MSIHFIPHADHATVRLHGAVDQPLVIELRDTLQQARDYWKYKRLSLEIQSPGGELLALRALLHEIGIWRRHGGRLETLALAETGSAAALVLSLGDIGHRTAHPYSRLLYHHTRVITQGPHAVTASHADAAARHLQREDRALLEGLTHHIAGGFGGPKALAQEGLTRCQRLHDESTAIAKALGVDAGFGGLLSRKAAGLLRQMIAAYEKTLTQGDARPYVQLLSASFAQDKPMPVDVAWGLLLIDAVDQVRALQPLQHQTVTLASTLRLAA